MRRSFAPHARRISAIEHMHAQSTVCCPHFTHNALDNKNVHAYSSAEHIQPIEHEHPVVRVRKRVAGNTSACVGGAAT